MAISLPALARSRGIIKPRTADATGVYALFATGDLVAFDPDGNLRWYRSLVGDYPGITNQVGMAASPVLAKDKLVVPMDNDGDSFLAAVDVKYGKNVWKVARPRSINWVTPLVRDTAGKTEVLFAGPNGLTAYDADNGSKRWLYKEGAGAIPTASLVGDTLYLPGGGVSAVKLGPDGPAGEPLMKAKEASTRHGSPPAATITCAVPGGEWKKSHVRRGRSSPSTTSTASPERTRKPSWSASRW